MESINFEPIVTFLTGLAPWVEYVFLGLGTLVVLGFGIDRMIPDQYDKNFMSFVMKVPVLGSFLKFLTRFSPFNVRE